MADGEEESPLSFVTMEEMVNEIRKRTSHFVLIVVRDTTEGVDSSDSWYGGGYYAAVGLCELTKAQLVKDYIGDSDE